MAAPTVVGTGDSLGAYTTGLPGPGPIAGLTRDADSGAFFYITAGTSSWVLNRFDTDGTITSLRAGSPAGYPFQSTDIQYKDDKVYSVMSGGGSFQLFRYNAEAPVGFASTPMPGPANIEGGIAVGDDGTMYVSHGSVTPGRVSLYDTDSNTFSTAPFSVPNGASSLEHDAVRNRLYLATNLGNSFNTIGFHFVDLDTGTVTEVLPAGAIASNRHRGNFAVDPSGDYLYTRVGTTIVRIDVETGVFADFITGLDSNTEFGDPLFGASSSGSGFSLYIGDGDTIWEMPGFVPAPGAVGLLALGGLMASRRRR